MATRKSPYYRVRVVPRSRPIVLLLALAISGCECVRVPGDDGGTCFLTECDGGKGGGGGPGGGSAGGGGGTAGGGSGGGLGGGVGGSGGGGGMPVGGGMGGGPQVLRGWQAVKTELGQLPQGAASPLGFSLARMALPPVTLDCAEKWWGGVLLPGNRVVAVPHCAAQPLLIDLNTFVATPLPAVPSTDAGVGRYAGGTLSCLNEAHFAPHGARSFAQVRVAPPAPNVVTYDVSSNPRQFASPLRAVGVVLDPVCRYHAMSAEGAPRWEPPVLLSVPLEGKKQPLDLSQGAGGLVLFDDTHALVPTFAKIYELDLGTSALTSIDDATTFGPHRGGAITRTGVVVFFDDDGTPVYVNPQTRTHMNGLKPPGVSGVGWPAFRGDGFVYAVGSQLVAAAESGGTVATYFPNELADAGPGAFAGLVATPSGALVAIPSRGKEVFVFIPDAGATAPENVLLSPFFNKL